MKNQIREPFREKYYVCPSCNELATETDLLKACSCGGLPFCYCEFGETRLLVGYKRISKEKWEKLRGATKKGRSVTKK